MKKNKMLIKTAVAVAGMQELLDNLRSVDTEMVPGSQQGKLKQGEFFGKLTRFIQRLESKTADKRLNFLFSNDSELIEYASLLPSRIKVNEPSNKPQSDTIKFWDEWSRETVNTTIGSAVEALRRQSKH